MATVSPKSLRPRFWRVPRVVALLAILAAAGGFAFIIIPPSTGPLYGVAQNRETALSMADNAYYEFEPIGRTNALPVPVAHTAAIMRRYHGGVSVRVSVHGADIMLDFAQGPTVCVKVPVIVYGGTAPRIVHC
ncbi:MAG TPA: hypothetical protein VND83_08555 [Acidimicrobiales bacterium]|nr:hypothetical protein [Acidimicrobiales bacterium]